MVKGPPVIFLATLWGGLRAISPFGADIVAAADYRVPPCFEPT